MSYKDTIKEIHKEGKKPTWEEYSSLGSEIWEEFKMKARNIFRKKK